jgi:hypothetical protein
LDPLNPTLARMGFHAMLTVVSWKEMSFPIKTCVVCEEEFELRPDKPGFANRCPKCSSPEEDEPAGKAHREADALKSSREANAARRQAIKDLLYSKK